MVLHNSINTNVQILKSEVNAPPVPPDEDQMSDSDQQNLTMESPMRYEREETPSKKTPTVDIQILSRPNIQITSSEQERRMMEKIRSRISGIPFPEKYNKYYITKYSLPKGLVAVKNFRREKNSCFVDDRYIQNCLIENQNHNRNFSTSLQRTSFSQDRMVHDNCCNNFQTN